MSEVYLTKIERKTIFTKSLIFVLIMFIISDLTVTGPFYFNFIPWMYIVGTIGSIKKIDNVLMCIIGTFTVLVSCLITQGGFNLQCIISTGITILLLILGIITGKLVYEFILEHRLVKYIKPSRKTIYIVSMVAMLVGSFVIVGMHSGNLIYYLNSKANLKKYIANTYGVEEFQILSTKFNKNVPGKYVYTAKLNGQDVYFVPIAKDNFKDANMTERLEKLNTDIQKETILKTEELLIKYPLLHKTDVTYSYEYTKLDVIPDILAMYIKCTEVTQDLDALYDQLSAYIKESQASILVDKVVISINKVSLEITQEDIQNITADYIKGGFEIEEISD